MRGVKLNYKRGLMAVLLIICFLMSVSGVSAAKLIDNKNKVTHNYKEGYITDSWKTYSYGSNHVIMKITSKTVLKAYPQYSNYFSYQYDFKKISKTKLKITYKDKYRSSSYTAYTKKSAVSYYKAYYKYFLI